MKSKGLVMILLVGAVAIGAAVWVVRDTGPAPVEAPALPAPPVGEGHNGLTDADRSGFYHWSEGGELFPLDWIMALEVETRTTDGTPQVRPFLDNIERYGLMRDAKGPGNPYGMPVGVSVGLSKDLQIPMIGLNCTACHVGQIQYKGRAMRIDGGPNMALINSFLVDMATETKRTLESPRRLVRFWERVRRVREDRRAAAPTPGEAPHVDEGLWQRLTALVTRNRGLVEAQLRGLETVPILSASLAISTKEGYGRLDAFGIARDELFGAVSRNSLPADAPVSIPHIWGMEYTGWLQWGANTNSVMERNIGQALGVGALFDPNTLESSVNLENLHQLEGMAYKITPPAWPDFLPPIDTARAARGRFLFVKNCVTCHQTYRTDGVMREYQLFSLDDVGTDPATALDFEKPVLQADGTVKPFPYAALDLIVKIKDKAYRDRGMDQQTIAQWERRDVRKGPRWDPTFRTPLLDADKWDDTRGRKVYRSKTLVGIWATGPFLHNGSVPTIHDLLKPAAERPVTFPLGSREYDPVKLGVQTDPTLFALPAGAVPFEFDTRLPGNWNSGHEWHFYPELTDENRYEIIEFLKTFNDERILQVVP